MTSTRQINDLNHEVREGTAIVGYVTRARIFPTGRPALGVNLWGFTASKEGLALGFTDTEWKHATWQDATPLR